MYYSHVARSRALFSYICIKRIFRSREKWWQLKAKTKVFTVHILKCFPPFGSETICTQNSSVLCSVLFLYLLKIFNVSVLSCSTPEHRQESPSRDSDSLYDSDAASPVPFLCTQDGAEGETDVVWNFYTPKSEHVAKSRLKNSTPIRRAKRIIKTTVIEKPLPKRRTVRATQKKTELFQDLIELNQNLHELIAKKTKPVLEEKIQPGSEEDIFSDSDSSLKTGFRTNSRCLRRNVLSSKFNKPETETALESDDSMNECLIKASQVVEENILNSEPTPAKRPCLDFESKHTQQTKPIKPSLGFKMDHDSMDAILNSIKLESPILNKTKTNSSRLINDSFDSLVGNLNDSTLDRLTQMPAKTNGSKLNTTADWTVQDVVVHDSSPMSKSFFGRHSSMPESPVVTEINKPSTSGMAFGRHNSMPYTDKNMNAGNNSFKLVLAITINTFFFLEEV